MLINILGLSLGITVSFLILLFVRAELNYDKFNENYNEIYRLEKDDWAVFGPVYGEALSQNFSGVKDFVRLDFWGYSNALVSWAEKQIRIENFTLADTSLFNMFSLEFLEGKPTALKDPNSIVLTEKTAQRIFGTASPMGQSLRVNNKKDFIVAGIIREPKNFHMPLQVIASFELMRELKDPKYFKQFGGGWNHPTYFQLEKGVDEKLLAKNINQYLSKRPAFQGKKPHFRLRPLGEIYFAEDIKYESLCKHGNKTYVYLFLAIAFLILAIAIVNYVNLTTARAPLRAREVGVRKVCGGLRSRLLVQFLLESLILTVLSFLIALLGIVELLPFFNNLLGSSVTNGFLFESTFWLVFVACVLGVGLLAGIYPAFVLTSYKSVEVFKANPQTGINGGWFRRALIVFQYTISIILIIFTISIYLQLDYFRSREMGFDKEMMLCVPVNSDLKVQKEVFKERLEQLPHVKGVAYSYSVPGKVKWQNTWPLDDQDYVQYTYFPMEPEYPELMGLEFLEGRTFCRERESDLRFAYILNETAVKAFGLKPPFVKSYQLPGWNTEIRVIGVVKDFHFNSLHQPIAPLVMGWRKFANSSVSIKLDGKGTVGTIEEIRKVWKEMSPGFPFEYQFLDESFDALYKKEEKFAQMFVWFSILAILIATLGLFGMAAFTTQQRRKEIGLRKVLGASDNLILRLLLGEFGRWVLLSGIIALPISWWGIGKWLNQFPYHIDIQIWVFAAGLLICFCIAMLTVSYHTYRAANLNPVDAIKQD
ncbi:MAG: ABC transporter permease [Marinifilaceae bacterium]